MTNRLPICEWSGLPRIWCPDTCPDHNTSFPMTDTEKALLENRFSAVLKVDILEQTAGRRLPEYRAKPRTVTRRGDAKIVIGHAWNLDQPKPARCPPGQQLCHDCANQLEAALGDVPAIVNDLNLALRKAVRFVPHAFTSDPDEAPLPFNPSASSALSQRATALGGEPVLASRWWLTNWRTSTHQTELLEHLTKAMAHAHKVIERPRDHVHLGRCPHCETELVAERGMPVTCPQGDYTADWDTHMATILANSQDQMFTISELVAATGLTRNQIKTITNYPARITHHKLTRPHLDGHTIRTRQVTVFRLGDIETEATRRGYRHGEAC